MKKTDDEYDKCESGATDMETSKPNYFAEDKKKYDSRAINMKGKPVSYYGYEVQSKYDSKATQTSVKEIKEKRCDLSSDDDLMKGSDDAAVKVEKSSKIQSCAHLVWPINRDKILLGTMLSIILIVLLITLSVTTLVLVSKSK